MILEHEFVCSRCGWRIYAPVHHGDPSVCAECQFIMCWNCGGAARSVSISGLTVAERWPSDRCLRWGIGICVVLWALLIGLVMAMVAHL